MAYYNANRVIKLTRKALGITQEKLSEGICEVENYSRIENGHHALRRSTYQKLMEKMGRNVDRRYAICVSKDGMLLDEKIELERAFKRYDFESAEKYLHVLKEKVDDSILSKQYLTRAEALVEYYRGCCSVAELIAKLDEAMKITVPEYERYLEKESVYPFTKIELLTLMSLGNAYRENREIDKSISIYIKILVCLEEKYLGEPDNSRMQITIRNNLSALYEMNEENNKAIDELKTCLKFAIQYDYGHLLPAILSAIAFNERKIKGEASRNSEIILLSQNAYYIALARGDESSVKAIRRFYKKIHEERNMH